MGYSDIEIKKEFDEMFLDSCINDFPILNSGRAIHEKDCVGVVSIASKQIGGEYYLNKIQTWDIIDSWGLNFYEGNILKYLLLKKNNRKEDLGKLIHYAEKLIELEGSD